ncbi:thiolase C-terminal domain-containing protein [Rhodococcus rhodochrous]|uniref:Lipid-transfer protein n=1 Tax=Rhodococcus rhodochrous KG-21 TaxID=1441923 RepID=A0A0M9WNS3_RHORH|nr:lipid-transfer protein [Rhodococcus rhodochrous]KOS55871.1 lipid-transfer protein [Rhodococcus rhodochrous KG-21]
MSTDPTWRRDACAIAGIGTTEYSRDSGVSVTALAVEAASNALADAGMTPADVDGIVRNDMDLVSCAALADGLGVPNLTYWGEAGPGGSGPAAMVAQAVAAIMSGQATTVVVFRSLNGRSGRRFGLSPVATPEVGGNETFEEFFGPYGLLSSGQYFALVAQRYMTETGLTAEQLAQIALVTRRRANANPAAQMYERTMTLDDYFDSRMLSSPLRLYDYCLETDGAAAVVVTTTERAEDLRQTPALIRSVAMSTCPHPQPGLMYPTLMREDITALPSRVCQETLYSRAGLGPADVDVAQIYDCYSITALIQLEDYGFCKRGDTGDFLADGQIDLGGSIPINTSGGHMSEGYIHGMNHVVEGVRQIRGTSTSQVEGARVSLVTSAPPPAASALILVSA